MTASTPPLDETLDPRDLCEEIAFRLKVVQIGVWEARRRCCTGETADLDVLLSHLDEDIQQLKDALDDAVVEDDALASKA